MTYATLNPFRSGIEFRMGEGFIISKKTLEKY